MNKNRARLAAAFLLVSAAAQAQESLTESLLDEIVVTSGLREVSIREVATSISVMDTEEIERLADQHFEELIRAIPNLSWSGDGHRARYFQIRGVGERSQYEGAPNPSVGFIVDDIDFSGIGTIATMFDMERVEVLRGPQGSRYGANALGGLIYLRSTTPGSGADNVVELGLADDDTLSVSAAFGADLSETVALRFSAQSYESDGFRRNTTLNRDDTNGRDETGLRARLRWEPSDTQSVDVAMMFTDVDNGYDAFSLDNSLTMLSDKPGKDAQESVGGSVRFRNDGVIVFESITAFADSDILFSFDADWGSDASWDPFVYDFTSASDRERRTLSQEFRFKSGAPVFNDSTSWLFGVYALRLEEDLLTVNTGEYFDPFFDFADSLLDAFNSGYESTNLAVFGELDTELTDRTRLRTGLRVERRTTDYADSSSVTASPSETMLGGEISLVHDVSDNATLYATLASAFKAGGFNLGIIPEERREFDQERLWNLEFGARADFGALSVDAALFFNRRDDQQVRTSTQLIPGDPASFIFFTDNAARGKSVGLEVEADLAITEEWSAFMNLGFLDASFDKYDDVSSNLEGRDQAHAPGYTIATGLQYRAPSGFFFSIDASATDSFYFAESHDQQSEAYELVNLRVGYESGPWSVIAWSRNLLDETYAVRGFFFGNEPPDFPDTLYTRQGDPRLTGITVRRSF